MAVLYLVATWAVLAVAFLVLNHRWRSAQRDIDTSDLEPEVTECRECGARFDSDLMNPAHAACVDCGSRYIRPLGRFIR